MALHAGEEHFYRSQLEVVGPQIHQRDLQAGEFPLDVVAAMVACIIDQKHCVTPPVSVHLALMLTQLHQK